MGNGKTDACGCQSMALHCFVQDKKRGILKESLSFYLYQFAGKCRAKQSLLFSGLKAKITGPLKCKLSAGGFFEAYIYTFVYGKFKKRPTLCFKGHKIPIDLGTVRDRRASPPDTAAGLDVF